MKAPFLLLYDQVLGVAEPLDWRRTICVTVRRNNWPREISAPRAAEYASSAGRSKKSAFPTGRRSIFGG
jgi:hypothetical protein